MATDLLAPEPTDAHPVDVGRFGHGPDAFPIGNPERRHLPGLKGVRMLPEEETADLRASEMFRVRERAHLFDDWMRDLVEDARAKAVETVDMYEWDCHSCNRAVMSHRLEDACPRCGSRPDLNFERAVERRAAEISDEELARVLALCGVS